MASRDVIGPALPPGFVRSSSPDDGSQVAGPALPPDYTSDLKRQDCDQDHISPRLPREANSDSEDDRDASQNPRTCDAKTASSIKDGHLASVLKSPKKESPQVQGDTPDKATSSILPTRKSVCKLCHHELRINSDETQNKKLTPDKLFVRKQRRLQDDDDGFFGPALPPGFKKQDDSPERPVIGPALPPGFKKQSEEDEENRSSTRSSVPSLSSSQASDSSEDEEGIIGPVPAEGPTESSVAADFDCRAQKMKEKLLGHDNSESKQVKRESWMTELPPELKGFGLGSRTFKRRADDESGDRSIWTDTPADRERKAKEMQDGKKSAKKVDGAMVVSERDKKLAERVSSHNDSQRSESLMEIHHKKLKRKAAEDKSKPQERRPFDRDQDLRVHQLDEAQKRALIKQSRDLNTRFSHSKCNMFL